MIIKEINNQIPANTQTLWPDNFTGEFCQIFKEELMPTLLKLFQKLKEEEDSQTNFSKILITLIQKADKDTTTKENWW